MSGAVASPSHVSVPFRQIERMARLAALARGPVAPVYRRYIALATYAQLAFWAGSALFLAAFASQATDAAEAFPALVATFISWGWYTAKRRQRDLNILRGLPIDEVHRLPSIVRQLRLEQERAREQRHAAHPPIERLLGYWRPRSRARAGSQTTCRPRSCGETRIVACRATPAPIFSSIMWFRSPAAATTRLTTFKFSADRATGGRAHCVDGVHRQPGVSQVAGNLARREAQRPRPVKRGPPRGRISSEYGQGHGLDPRR